MNLKRNNSLVINMAFCLMTIFLFSCSEKTYNTILDKPALANQYFQEDAQWYPDNVPFFEWRQTDGTSILLSLEII